LDKVITTSLLAIGAVTAAFIVITVIGPTISRHFQAVVASQTEAAARIKTSIEVIVVAPNAAGTQVDVWVKNVGPDPIKVIEKSDVFLIQPGTRYDALTYNNDGVTTKTWYGDLKESGLPWNKADTLQITITLVGGDVILADTNYALRMATPNAATAEKIFTR